MIETPRIIQTTTRQTALIHLTVSLAEMQEVFGPAIGELIAGITAQGIAPVGPVFTHHLRSPGDTFDFELSIEVSAPVKAAGRMQPGEWPAMKVAQTVYHGPYEGLPGAWGEFVEWMEGEKLRQADDLWEVYATGPQSSPDPADWRTELNRPLVE